MKIAAARPQISRATSIATDAPFSLQTDGGDSESMVEMGTFAYIAKSFQLDDIEDALTRAITRHEELITAR